MPKQPAPKVLKAECGRCDAYVIGDVEGSFTAWDNEGPPERISLLQCPKCGRPVLVSEDYLGSQGDREYWDDPWRLYPPRDKGLSPPTPRPLRDAFAEAQRCYRAKAYTAAAIMCRKTLEGLCESQGAKKAVLRTSLKELRESGVIDDRLYEWADQLRITGNDAAHGVTITIAAEDAEDALAFTEAIVDYVFTYRQRFEEFKSRREERAAAMPKVAARKRTVRGARS